MLKLSTLTEPVLEGVVIDDETHLFANYRTFGSLTWSRFQSRWELCKKLEKLSSERELTEDEGQQYERALLEAAQIVLPTAPVEKLRLLPDSSLAQVSMSFLTLWGIHQKELAKDAVNGLMSSIGAKLSPPSSDSMVATRSDG